MSYINTVRVDTSDYSIAHGRQPKGTGAWAFYMGCRDDINKLFCAPKSASYTEARKLAVQEARRLGVDYVSVGA